jgi:hypothetical protein
MSEYRNFQIQYTILPDPAGQYEAAFSIAEINAEKENDEDGVEGEPLLADGTSYDFPPVGSYLTPDDAREQTEAWARKWIDLNF